MEGQFGTTYRTHTLGALRTLEPGQAVAVCGWFAGQSDDRTEVTLMDRSGRAGVRIPASLVDAVKALGRGDIVRFEARVTRSSQDRPTLEASTLEVLSHAQPQPFDVYGEEDREPPLEQRLRFRYLDLRRPTMQRRLEMRSRALFEIRRHFIDNGFVEIETPVLGRWTSEATTAYIAPAGPGECYGLTQTPQIYKQLLMVGGVDRYFQLARCFRREAELTPERQPEFTSLDLEMSYVRDGDVLDVVDGVLAHLWRASLDRELEPVPRLTYDEAMMRYGTDRPDLRFGLEIVDISELAKSCESPALRFAADAPSPPGGAVRAIRIPAANAGRLDTDRLDALAEQNPDPRKVQMSWAKFASADSLTGPMASGFETRQIGLLRSRLEAGAGDVVLFFYGKNRYAVGPVAGALRRYLGHSLNLVDRSKHALVWVTAWPYWGYEPTGDCFVPARHPFTHPDPAHLRHLENVGPMDSMEAVEGDTRGAPIDRWSIRFGDEREELLKVRTLSYELILNGEELATGSIRNHDLALQERIFSMFGYAREVVDSRFGALLAAFRHGVPPHGGIALGVERLLAQWEATRNIGDVEAFPKDSRGRCLVTGAPSPIDPDFLRTLLGM